MLQIRHVQGGLRWARMYSSAPSRSIVHILRSDLKAALKSRSKLESTVIRSILSSVADVEKQSLSSTPVSTPNSDILRAIQEIKMTEKVVDTLTKSVDESIRQYISCSRTDLADKEQSEKTVLTKYKQSMAQIRTDIQQEFQNDAYVMEELDESVVGDQEAGRAVADCLAAGCRTVSEVMKRLCGPDGRFRNRVVDRKALVEMVKRMVKTGE